MQPRLSLRKGVTMDLLSGTLNAILTKLDEKGMAWRDQAKSAGANQQVHKVTLDRDRVFYVNEVGPGKNVTVVFVPPISSK